MKFGNIGLKEIKLTYFLICKLIIPIGLSMPVMTLLKILIQTGRNLSEKNLILMIWNKWDYLKASFKCLIL